MKHTPATYTLLSRVVFCVLILFLSCSVAVAFPKNIKVSPKDPWNDFEVVTVKEPHWTRTALLWLPNRVLDFFDIFRLDLGVGPSYGASVKATEYVQLGYRKMDPTSIRVGLFGRHAPWIVEEGREAGISTYYEYTEERPRCSTELGASLDILVAGAHAGICFEEIIDFFAGFGLEDTSGDDFE